MFIQKSGETAFKELDLNSDANLENNYKSKAFYVFLCL